MFGSLFARLPAIKLDLGLSDGELAVALLCGSIGLIASQPVAGALATRFGSRPVTAAGLIAYGALLVLPAVASDPATLGLAFAASGAAAGVVDVAMNAQGAIAEERHLRPVFSSFHAGFSFGAMAGAGLAGVAAALDVAPAANLAVAGAIGIALGLPTTRWMAAGDGAEAAGRSFARPSGRLTLLGVIALCAAMSEGAIGDWSAIVLAESRGASEAAAVAGLAAFSAAMGFGRLAADPLREHLGSTRLLRYGAGLVIAGVAAAVIPLGPWAAVAGFAVAGAGLASLFPVSLLLGSRAPGQSPAAGIAAVSTAGYAGFLLGPATIGFLGEATSLPAALGVLIALALVVVWLAPRAAPAE
jgi:MFS family permease